MTAAFTGFAVFDLETTGFSPNRHHRVIEIGVVRLDEDLDVIEEWETLIDPERDVSATDVHGITASDVKGAPKFADLIADIWHRFEGAVPVAHNLAFDARFMVAEFERAGIAIPEFGGICTMRLASQLGMARGRRRLGDLCLDLGIPVRSTHSAGSDAWMCAEILKKAADNTELSNLAAPVSCPDLWMREATALGITRQKARDAPIKSPMQQVSERLNGKVLGAGADTGKLDEYLLVLDRVLEDRVVDPSETEELIEFALSCGFNATDIAKVHERYVANLVALVLSDGIVTDDERADLQRVSGLLGVGAETVQHLLDDGPKPAVCIPDQFSGKTVCFTGDLRCSVNGERITRDVAQDLVKAAGMTPIKNVTKKLDILVVADPDTASGKAKKARSYGTRIIAERSFWQKLGLSVG